MKWNDICSFCTNTKLLPSICVNHFINSFELNLYSSYSVALILFQILFIRSMDFILIWAQYLIRGEIEKIPITLHPSRPFVIYMYLQVVNQGLERSELSTNQFRRRNWDYSEKRRISKSSVEQLHCDLLQLRDWILVHSGLKVLHEEWNKNKWIISVLFFEVKSVRKMDFWQARRFDFICKCYKFHDSNSMIQWSKLARSRPTWWFGSSCKI